MLSSPLLCEAANQRTVGVNPCGYPGRQGQALPLHLENSIALLPIEGKGSCVRRVRFHVASDTAPTTMTAVARTQGTTSPSLSVGNMVPPTAGWLASRWAIAIYPSPYSVYICCPYLHRLVAIGWVSTKARFKSTAISSPS
jgi:hypothetical protein